jgi:hypothetical protein
MDKDKFLDIVIGNYEGPNKILMNRGNGTYIESIFLIGGDTNKKTRSIALGDIHKDGWLDIIIGNDGERNQIIYNRT